MGLFGKKKISTDEVFRDVLGPFLLDITVDKNWDDQSELLVTDTINVDRVASELFNLKMFFVDLAIYENTDGSIRDQFREQLFNLVQKVDADASKNMISRQASYGDTYINCPFPKNGPSREYYVVKRFGEFVEADPLDPIIHMALTNCASIELISLNHLFKGLNDQYRIVES